MKTILIIFIWLSGSCCAQTPLVGIQDGQWFSYSNGTKFFLPRDMHDVGNFDSKNLAYFMRHNLYGLINAKGEVALREQYIGVEQLKGGYYQFLKRDGMDFVQLANGKLEQTKCRSIQKVDIGWYLVDFDSARVLVNTENRIEIPLAKNDRVIQSFHGYISLKLSDSLLLYDPFGKVVEMNGIYPTFSFGHLVIEGLDQKKIVYPDHVIELPREATNIKMIDNDIQYTANGSTKRIPSAEGEAILEVKCDDMRTVSKNLIEFRVGNKVGIVNFSGKIICPAIYNFISIQDGLLLVWGENGAGVRNFSGSQLVPCKYANIWVGNDFFITNSSLNLQGIISRKNNKEILNCVYDRVMYSNEKIRAWSMGKIRIIELGEKHEVLSDLVLDNVITLDRQEMDKNKALSQSFDQRLLGLGWFMSNVPIFDSLGFNVGEVQKWGLHGVNDTILLPQRYSAPTFVPQADFSLLPGPLMKIVYDGEHEMETPSVSIVSHRTGKMLVNEPIISVDTLDLLTRSYTRFVGSKGPGFILSDNTILSAHYIDGADTKYVRYCYGKKREMYAADKSEFDAVRFPNLELNDDPARWIPYSYDGENYDYVRYQNVTWNFLDTAGRQLFAEPLDFAYPYRGNTAIVMRGDKWGVAREDSITIPTIYAAITRASELSDTIFLVKNTPGGTRYLDSTAKTMEIEMTNFGLNRGSLSQVQIGANKVIITPDYRVISGESRYQKLFDHNLFYAKEKKEYNIYSGTGAMLGSTLMKPEEFIGEEYIITSEKGKKGVLNMNDEILIPFSYKEIQKQGEYLFAIDGVDNLLYDENLNLLMNFKSSRVFVDSITGNYAEYTGTKLNVYEAESGDKLGSWKGTDFIAFHNGWLIDATKESRLIHISGKEITLAFQVSEVVAMGDCGYLLNDVSRVSHYFSPDWIEKTFKSPLKRAKYLGEGRAVSRTRMGLVLFGGETEEWYEMSRSAKGEFSNGYLLLHQKGRCFFVNPDGVNVFRREFIDATPFGTKYATVEEAAGWTLLDVNGHLKALPGFNRLEELGSNVFSTTKQPVYGLLDAHGNEIIPVKFQKITILSKNLIQGIHNGEIHYFNRKGEEILLN